MIAARDVVVTGGTGYIGRRLVGEMLTRGHRVRVLTRRSSIDRVPAGAAPIIGNALDADSFASALSGSDTIVHLVGTPSPGPAKAKAFQTVDLVSIRATVDAAVRAGSSHLVYVSVAQPAPVMHAYLAVRAAGEAAIAGAGLTATVLRPWYVLGPGHWWPLGLLPVYHIAKIFPSMRPGADRLGLVTLRQMVVALTVAVEDPPPTGSVRIVDVPGIRSARLN